MEVFYFSRLSSSLNSPPLNISPIGSLILQLKNLWRYLGFIFNKKLTFCYHINFYANKAISTVKCMKLLGNSSHGLIPQQKYLLYRSCILPITLYGFQLWSYNKVLLSYPLKELNKMQRRAAIWILGVFCISLSFSIETIIGLIPIKLHLQKLSGRLQLRAHSLLYNHILKSLLETI